ncbi:MULTISPECIES: BolA family protein [Methylococcus]|jgi:BolA protein|uniref:BolA family transcriptional regulator, general stress-responsive regulator n=1 Tax=Methylococcus capsulatus TaxID=414 RepID=A0AA35V6K5_METCP|nr:BolA family protein [Methylococcus capsulatus]QXP87694.1 BolA family transcriptional regulator [Methylococcus capsulatus]QXP90954.1 BolA family transcriptional regulator [Methylococcus capsulatus]QXP92566.1 BolA family transcriptional regulator [Methylococcus capsulatus]UQN12711.1 BolA family transcriptional regulator [Methylococcus capsulatus]CAI8877379.1 BolA family transcriptional regulator, general stress-responsive regulator [Methylococcus capsulatus]
MSSRVEQIRERLQGALAPLHLEIIDESASHAGHAGAMAGGGHFHATIVSAAFDGKSLVQRHQMVYSALGDMMHNEIHAFSMKALTPSEHPTTGNL